MFRDLWNILLFFILIFLIRYCLTDNTEQNATDACTCDVEIDVVRKFMDDLEVAQKSGTKLESKMSNIEKLLIANRVPKLPTNCMEAAGNSTKNGVYHIQLQNLDIDDLKVFCVEDVDFGGWLVIQRRQSDSVDFYRNWTDYKEGFGDLTGNYWIGLQKLHALTSDCEQELYIQMRRRNGKEYYAKYTQFVIGGESKSYALKKLGNYSGDAGDSFYGHLGMKFSTYDRDNDTRKGNCAKIFKGAWWFANCYLCHLNGSYGDDEAGVNWVHIERIESLAFAQMMIRPTRNCLKQLLLRNLNAGA